MTIEIEFKYKVNSFDKVKEKLMLINAKFVSRIKTRDIYFNPIHKNYKETDEALRIRITEGEKEVELTYKGPKFSTRSKSREEYNVSVNDMESLLQILSHLDYETGPEVVKTREKWSYDEYEILLDSVEGLGTFVEIEAICHDHELFDARENELKAFAIQLGINPELQIMDGYLDLLESKYSKTETH